MDFPTRHSPFTHQREELERNYHQINWGVFWEQGTGKTKLEIDNTVKLFIEGRIDAVVILAPEGVHTNWVLDEIPEHISPDQPYLAHEWMTSKATTIAHKKKFKSLMEYEGGLKFLSMTYSAYMTKAGKSYITKFFETHRVFFILDESTKIKSPGIKLTRSLLAFGKRADYRRVLTGTPVTNSPFDLYAQMKFLVNDFWKAHGLNSFYAFKNYFGEWQPIQVGPNQSFDKLVKYCNLEELSVMVSDMTSRVRKDDVLDLPPKQYSKCYFDMPSATSQAFKELKKEFMTVIQSADDKQEAVFAELAIVRLTRCQQVSCGFMQIDGGEVHQLEKRNPRLKALDEIIETHPGKMIIWCRFKPDINLIMDHLKNEAVRYDGDVPTADRHENKTRFQEGDARFFVANPAAAASGLTLHAAETVVYYSNSFSNWQREQSEDRAHRAGLKHTVKYIDIVARDSYDQKILDSLRQNKSVADAIVDGDFTQ